MEIHTAGLDTKVTVTVNVLGINYGETVTIKELEQKLSEAKSRCAERARVERERISIELFGSDLYHTRRPAQ